MHKRCLLLERQSNKLNHFVLYWQGGSLIALGTGNVNDRLMRIRTPGLSRMVRSNLAFWHGYRRVFPPRNKLSSTIQAHFHPVPLGNCPK
ncbi:unnamed protein product [Protopolystoma xenopodis]|uniref:Uncharacterized protein n=1 Tax=Protopolystoma xenopodis TaxID=117903 RepID=A0A448WYI9_9PLAT|nr:unnamed protein product [Protopolystoma xenopodis]